MEINLHYKEWTKETTVSIGRMFCTSLCSVSLVAVIVKKKVAKKNLDSSTNKNERVAFDMNTIQVK